MLRYCQDIAKTVLRKCLKFLHGEKNMAAAVTAGIIFILMFVLIITEKIPRHFATMGCGILTLSLVFGLCMRDAEAILNTLNFGEIFTKEFWYLRGKAESVTSGINWATIIFIAGMMVMVEGMAESGFFKYLCLKIAELAHYRALRIFVAFMMLSAFLSMFIDSITVILFLAAITAELGLILSFNPVPMILAEIFCANLGGAATMCGDPPNVIIGTSLGYTFGDFVQNTGVIVIICMVVTVVYFMLAAGGELRSKTVNYKELSAELDPKAAITNKRAFTVSVSIFLITAMMLVTHATTGFTVALIGTFAAAATILAAGKKSIQLLKRVDGKTLLFFIGLFIVVGGLEETGVLEMIASLIGKFSNGNAYAAIGIILIVSAAASAFVDNIPFAATMIPIIKSLAVSQGIPLETLAWTLALGTDIGGSATPIGASANVVGVSISAKYGHNISWKKFCGFLTPATILVIAICLVYLFVRYI